MADVTYPGATGIVGVTDAANFIPELWSDDIIAGYKTNLVMGNLVTKINHVGKKGDTIHIPAPTRGSANAKAENTAVTIQMNAEGKVDVSINKHYEYSRLIEDIVDVQALDSLRRFYTEDAGYALAKQIDSDIFAQFESLQGGGAAGTGDWAGAVLGGDGATAYTGANESALTEAGLIAMFLTLDNADVPMDGRKIIIPPVAKASLLAITEYTSADYISGRPVVNGMIGNIYGADVIVSSNAPAGQGSDRIGMVMHKDAIVFAEQMSVRSQTQYKQEYLADLMTSDCIYGVAELRNDAAVTFAVPA